MNYFTIYTLKNVYVSRYIVFRLLREIFNLNHFTLSQNKHLIIIYSRKANNNRISKRKVQTAYLQKRVKFLVMSTRFQS